MVTFLSQEGEPILKLPEKHVELVFVDFSPDEREVSKYEQPSFVPALRATSDLRPHGETSTDSDQSLHPKQ